MLEDRDYMRQTRHAPMSVTAILTCVFVAVYALQCINDVYLKTPAEDWLALTREGLLNGWLWQLISFQFLHLNLIHIICNLFVFWWVGHFVERAMGVKKFLIAMLGCGAIGGILQGALMLAFPNHFGESVVGASAGVSGLFAIFALLERDTEVRLYLVLPIRAIALLWILGGISLFFTLVPTPREWGMAHTAHLGGILAGILWVKLGWHREEVRLPWENWFARRKTNRAGHAGRNSGADADLTPEEFVSQAVDPILDKISAQGIQSLTERERKILEKARDKMAKR